MLESQNDNMGKMNKGLKNMTGNDSLKLKPQQKDFMLVCAGNRKGEKKEVH